MRAVESERERNAQWIAVLTRLHDVEPGLAHELRSAAWSGRMSHGEAMRAVRLLERLPMKGEAK